MRLYFDSSALLKRVFSEKQSSAIKEFVSWATKRGDTCFTSQLGRIETVRALRRDLEADAVTRKADRALRHVDLYPMDSTVAKQAEIVGTDTLRALDAIHLATALVCRANAVVTYDERLRWAAFEAGLLVIQPGGPSSGDLPPGWAWMDGVVPMDDGPAHRHAARSRNI